MSKIPDSHLARQATERVREVLPEFLLNHCLRTWRFASAIGAKRGLRFDAELLYLSAVLHDIGLAPGEKPRRGAEVALTFLGTATDVAGLAFAEVDPKEMAEILSEIPRLGMKERIRGALLEVIRRNPRAA